MTDARRFHIPNVDPDDVVFIDGAYVAAAEAAISPFDRGFLFADAIYEVAAVLDGRLVDNAAHFKRLERSLREMKLPRPMSDAEIETVQRGLIDRNGLKEGLIYLQITRGAAKRDFAMPTDPRPSVFAFAERRPVADAATLRASVRIATLPDLRWKRCDVKTTGLLGASMAKTQAIAAGFDDAWMVDANGLVTEASSSNVAIVTADGAVATRPLGPDILPGVTRAAVLRLIDEVDDLRLDERPFTVAEAQGAREAFQTSASSFVQPVVAIDGKPVSDGRPGEHTLRLQELYLEFARKTAV